MNHLTETLAVFLLLLITIYNLRFMSLTPYYRSQDKWLSFMEVLGVISLIIGFISWMGDLG